MTVNMYHDITKNGDLPNESTYSSLIIKNIEEQYASRVIIGHINGNSSILASRRRMAEVTSTLFVTATLSSICATKITSIYEYINAWIQCVTSGSGVVIRDRFGNFSCLSNEEASIGSMSIYNI